MKTNATAGFNKIVISGRHIQRAAYLRQLLVGALQAGDTLGEEAMDLRLFLSAGQVDGLH